ncbi:MAG TPA: lactonase family protein [Gemmatimonadaceae bacterium]|nr:lactonase family protein [Gemmatimonadaceae bacterium]
MSDQNARELSRRDFLALSALGIAGCAVPGVGGGARGDDRMFYVGTYTEKTASKGIYLLRLSPGSGALAIDGVAAATLNPSFVALSPDGAAAFAVNEVGQLDGQPGGGVTAFGRDVASGALRTLGRELTRGADPCYASTDNTGRFLFVANYSGGSIAMYPVLAGGGIGAMAGFIQHHGDGPNAGRQEGPHAHCVIPDPMNRFVLVADLGIDRIMVYRFDAQGGVLNTATAGQGILAPGAGPRHLAFHPGGRVLYVTNELNSTVAAFRYDAETGSLTGLQAVPSVGEPAAVQNFPADIHVHPSGRFLYVSNRGHNSIAAFAIDPGSAKLTPLQLTSTEGDWPRNFVIDPSGEFLIVANQRSDSIHSFRIDSTTGKLRSTGHRVTLPAPVCLRSFAERA